MHARWIGLVIAAAFSLAACGSASVVGSCDLRNAGAAAQPYCQEYRAEASLVAAFQSACTGAWVDAACTHQSAVGGCSATSTSPAVTIVTWYYTGGPYMTAADVMTACAASGTFVAP